MDAHSIILTTLTKRQFAEFKNKYRKALKKTYGTNHSIYDDEGFEDFILFLAKLAFSGYSTLYAVFIFLTVVTFLSNGFAGGVLMLSITCVAILWCLIINKIKLKMSFAATISLQLIYWKIRIYRVPTPETD